MNRRLCFAALAFSLLTSTALGHDSAADAAGDSAWKAGAAKVAITPEEPMWMAGYAARTRPADGKATELWAKALVLEDADGKRGLVLTLDLVGIDRTLAQAVCDALKEQYGLQRKQIAICTSHTHSGPVVGRNLGPLHYLLLDALQRQAVDAWVAMFQKQVVAVVGEAIGKLAPSELSWGSGTTKLAVNRRENPAATVPQWRTAGKLLGPSDYDVPVLAVRDTDGNLIAVLFGYACHATTLSGYQWSGDYPGYAQMDLEEAHPGCVALFFAGCGADQNPLPRGTVPSRRVLAEGGYEGGGAMVYYGLPTVWSPEIENDIVDEVHRQVELVSNQDTTANEPPNASSSKETSLIASISKETLWRNRDGQSQTWFHPRVCMLPDANGQPVALMTLQQIGGSDYFGQVHWSISTDLGRTWSDPEPIAALGRDPVPGREDDLKAAVCDVVPQYDPVTQSLLAMGHVVFYKGDYFARKEQLARYPVYVTRDQDGTWSERKILQWDDPRGSNIYSNGCGQRVVLPDGDVLMSFTFGPGETNRMVSGVRAAFDGELLKVKDVGPPLHNDKGRGLLEPSVAEFGGKFWITLRAEDNRGYVSVSDDGLNYEEKRAWAWDDGTPIDMSTTQQHWLTHSDGLFLVYTRQDESNKNVIRWRSPLWVAQVDTDNRCLIKSSEQVVLPLVGDGIEDPNQVALMGNFHVTHASPEESWVTVGEWMPRDGYRGDVLLARIRWSKPNRSPLW